MKNREIILKTVDFIESHLTSDIQLADIAQSGHYSLYHFVRLFQNVVGLSPHKYLLQRRLTEAVLRLRSTDEKVINLAFDYQFGSHEAFTRSFKKHFGTTPLRVRKGEGIPAHLLTSRVTESYLYQSKTARNVPPTVIQLEEKRLVGLSFFIHQDQESIDLTREWTHLMKEAPQIPNKATPESYYQVQYWSDTQDWQGMHFFLGAEVEHLQEVPPQLVIKVIPRGTYLRFTHQGLSKNVGYTYQYIYQEYLPETEYKLPLPFNFEYYGEKYLSPTNEASESYVYIPILG
ncbi:MAG: AraC family transcriptional regulator [Bacteroidota bacterium]